METERTLINVSDENPTDVSIMCVWCENPRERQEFPNTDRKGNAILHFVADHVLAVLSNKYTA